METDIQHEAPNVTAEAGYVVIDGERGVALTVTAEVAQELAERLLTAAVVALGQRSAD